MDRGLADLLGTEIRDGVNTGRLDTPFQRNYTRKAYADPMIDRKQGESLLQNSPRNRSASPDTEQALQAWQQKKWDTEEAQYDKEQAMSGIKNIITKAGLGVEEFKEMISKMLANAGETYKEPWQ